MDLPAFYATAPVVRTRDPLAALLGAAAGGILEYRYADAVRLAGHSCPTVAGAFLMGRAALAALYPGVLPERGGVSVRLPAPEDEGTTGVTAQVLTLLTGAAAANGFPGLGGRHARRGLLHFAARREGTAIRVRRVDSGACVEVDLDLDPVPVEPRLREALGAVLADVADAAQRAEFAAAWQERVHRLLLEFADDPCVVRVTPVSLAAPARAERAVAS